MSQIHIGTSGWSYDHWKGIFYPKDLKYGTELEYYVKHLNTVEINSTFYHLPKYNTWKGWWQRTPRDFIFSVKGSRFISHILKLDNPKDPLGHLISGAKVLKNKLGPILLQFPEHLEANHDRLEKFCQLVPKEIRFSLEFRHPSWFSPKTYGLLKQYRVALVIADSPKFPKEFVYTADFVYVRLHGSQKFGASKYTPKELKNWASKIRRWNNRGLEVFVYFNNDKEGNAVKNAKELLALTTIAKPALS